MFLHVSVFSGETMRIREQWWSIRDFASCSRGLSCLPPPVVAHSVDLVALVDPVTVDINCGAQVMDLAAVACRTNPAL